MTNARTWVDAYESAGAELERITGERPRLTRQGYGLVAQVCDNGNCEIRQGGTAVYLNPENVAALGEWLREMYPDGAAS